MEKRRPRTMAPDDMSMGIHGLIEMRKPPSGMNTS
jgi:hypothetical protein